jgi:peptidoglycan hydrolase CwlO-like protein
MAGMTRRTSSIPRSLSLLACALASALAFASAPVSALAAPSVESQLAARKAEAAKIEKELAALRPQLEQQMAEYDQASADLEDARQALLVTSAEIEQLDEEIVLDQQRLDERVIAIYKSGGLDELELLLGVRSMGDFIERLSLMSVIQDNDARLLAGMRTTRGTSGLLQQEQQRREGDLIALRQTTDARARAIEVSVAKQERLMASVGADIAKLVRAQEEAAAAAAAAAAEQATRDGGSEPPTSFPPNNVVSDAKFMASGSMSVEQVQSFLNGQAGDLKSYSGPDHSGATKTAAQMIAEAAVEFGVSPKVIIVTLQKEQSLIGRPNPSQYALDWAMGCGKAESFTITSFKGFGNQVYNGARVLMKNRAGWRTGKMLPIDGNAVYPENASTYSLYRYTPHFSGCSTFWRLYWRYFGDPR